MTDDMRISGIRKKTVKKEDEEISIYTAFCDYCEWQSFDYSNRDTAQGFLSKHIELRTHRTNAKPTRIAGYGKRFRRKS